MISLRRLSAWCVLLLSILAVPAIAESNDGPARLVADFAPGSDAAGLSLSGAATLGNRAVFLSPGHEHQPILWVTDGTPDGTRALAALCPPCDGASLLGSTGSVAFYKATRSGPHAEMQIWRTDGTQAGTFPVMTAPGNPALSSINGGLLFFVACTPAEGCELWLSDGTVAGTRLAGDLIPGPANGDIRQIAAAGDKAFAISGSSLWSADRSGVRRLLESAKIRSLSADRGRAFFLAEVGRELEVWTSDGTAAGTRPVTSFGPKNPFGRYPFATLVDGRFYFTARPGKGNDLWSVGATRESLRRLTDLHNPMASFNSVRKAGSRILIVAQINPQRLWVSRGDSRSTAPLSGCPGGCPDVQSELAPLGQGRFVFKGSNKSGEALWVTDGTGKGTRALQHTGRFHELARYVPLGDRALFQLTNEYETGELWLTDGTPAGTFFLAPGGPHWSHYYGWGGPLIAVQVNRTVLFSALPDEDEPYDILMTSDGSPGGMRELARFRYGRSSYPQQLLALGDRLLVQTCTAGSAQEIRAVRGTETAVLLTQPYESCDPLSYRYATLNGRAAFLLFENTLGNGLWVTDGTPAGTTALIPAAASEEPVQVVPFGDRFAIWMIVPNGASEWSPQLWVSDGTPAGTGKLLDLPAGTDMLSLTAVGDRLYFFDFESILNSKYRMRPWVSDGTAAGTHALTGANGTTPEESFVELAGRAYFRFTPEGGRTEIWSTDGTPAGTGPAVSAGTAQSGMLDPLLLTAAGGRLYFQARRAADGRTGPLLPWVSDGTDAGTMPLADAAFEEFEDVYYPPSARPGFVELGDRVYFSASDPEHGDELWSTDGTPEGTRLVKDITPGPLGSYPRSLVAWNGRLWFRARDIAHGMELWTSDGTAEGTRLVDDVSPGPFWSTPMGLTVAGESLYFSANDGEHGRELWELPASELDVP